MWLHAGAGLHWKIIGKKTVFQPVFFFCALGRIHRVIEKPVTPHRRKGETVWARLWDPDCWLKPPLDYDEQ